ncbi:MAG: hypothetical protein OXG19_06800 [Chloroflexi bacterium]|nr:hypothetical protein [Chloroflexota bacterium]
MLTILTALPWEASAFSRRLRRPRRVELGDGWATWGERKGAGVWVVVSGPGMERAAATGAALTSLDPPASRLLAVGVAGGMRAGLAPGTVVLAEAFQRQGRGGQRVGERLQPDKDLAALGVEALDRARVPWTRGESLTVAAPLRRAEEKRDRGSRSQASVVQMEDYLWAEAAGELGLPFTSLRAVLDPVEADLPSAVESWDWRGPSVSEVARSLLRGPSLALALPRLAWRRRAARRAIDAVLEALVDTPRQGAHA